MGSRDLVAELVTTEGFEYITKHATSTDLHSRINDDQYQSFHFKRVTAPVPVLDILRSILRHAVDHKQIGPFHAMMESNIKVLQQSLHSMERVLDTQLPFAYISHVRTAVCIYCMSIPFFLVKENGWYTVLFVTFYCYVVFGLENLAVEIEDPFGNDTNDLPMDVYCSTISRDICDMLKRRQNVQVEARDTVDEGQDHSDDGGDDCDDGGDDGDDGGDE